jgi:hypothetical protein
MGTTGQVLPAGGIITATSANSASSGAFASPLPVLCSLLLPHCSMLLTRPGMSAGATTSASNILGAANGGRVGSGGWLANPMGQSATGSTVATTGATTATTVVTGAVSPIQTVDLTADEDAGTGACHTYHNVFANGKANAEHNSNLACSSVAATAAVTATATTATAQQLGTAAWNPTQVSDDAANAARAFSSAA